MMEFRFYQQEIEFVKGTAVSKFIEMGLVLCKVKIRGSVKIGVFN